MTKNIAPKALSNNDLMYLIPATIDIEELSNSVISKNLKIEFNKLLSLISLITTKSTSYNYKKERHETSKKANIHSDELKECCGNKYKDYIDFLFDSNILSKRSPYSKEVKGQTFGYGFNNSHAFRRLKLIKLTNSKSVFHENKFSNSYVKKYEEIFYKLFDRTKFSLDFNLAEEKLFYKYLENVVFPFDSNFTDEWYKYSAYHGGLKQLVKFLNGHYSFSRETKHSKRKPSGRFYSSLTFLNKVTRSLLYYEGKKLQQLDVKNMFPYLLSQHLKETAILDIHRVKRLQGCPAFKAKYKLNNTPYISKKFVSSPWLEQYLIEKYGALLLSKSMSAATNRGLAQQEVSKNFFLDIPKSLFQYSDSYSQQFNKKFYSDFLHNNTQTGNWNHNGWKPKREIKTQRETNLNSYNPTKELYGNSNFGRTYTESYKGSNLSGKVNPTPVDYSNYISTKIIKTLMNKEISKFNTLSIEGLIYDHFIELFKTKYSLIEWGIHYQRLLNDDYKCLYEQDRELAKKLFISMLYARNNHYIKEQEVFKSEFPILYDLIREKKKGYHKIITNELFDLEAELIVDTIARDLIKKKIPTFTIHDCIAVQEENIEVSELKMEDAFISRFGSCPQIKLE